MEINYPNIDELMILQQEANKLERFTLYGIITYGKIISVYDGDTFDMTFILPISSMTKQRQISKKKKGVCLLCNIQSRFISTERQEINSQKQDTLMMRMKCRLHGLDAKELKSEGGQKAKDILEGYILNKVLRCEFYEWDKYGRLLVKLYFTMNGKEYKLNEHLKIYSEYFIFYDGGTNNE